MQTWQKKAYQFDVYYIQFNLHFDMTNSILWQRKNISLSYKPVEVKDKIYYNQGIELCCDMKIYF